MVKSEYSMKTILITGSNGFIATNFYRKFTDKYRFILLSHKLKTNHITLEQLASDIDLITSINVVVNLAGANIANSRWTRARKDELLKSRLEITTQLVKMFNKHNRNIHFISASAVGVYDLGTVNNENTLVDYSRYDTFSQQLTKQWEQAALGYHGLVTITRFGVVLSSKGGAMNKILLPFLFGLGGQLSDGQQYFSWIALDDLLVALNFIIDKKEAGIFNLTAPEQISNKKFTQCIGKIWHRPIFMKMPACVIRLLWGQMGDELLLNGSQVIPKRLIDSEFSFKYPNILDCLYAIRERLV